MSKIPARSAALIVVTALMLGACKEQPPSPAAAVAVIPPPPPIVVAEPAKPLASVDGWVGKWTGPEGTYMEIEGGAGRYAVIIRNLDSTIKYPATVELDTLRFDRGGVMETVRATDGATTGMKWLSEKKNCLTVKTGEGYCRD